MNREQRRRQAAMAKQNKFVDDYVHQLPEVRPDDLPALLGEPGVYHTVFYHDEDCTIYDGKTCTCEPIMKLFVEPQRS